MYPENKAAYVLADNEEPDLLAYIMYALLNDENKEKINLLVAQLKAGQS
jgi:hypothetical protein